MKAGVGDSKFFSPVELLRFTARPLQGAFRQLSGEECPRTTHKNQVLEDRTYVTTIIYLTECECGFRQLPFSKACNSDPIQRTTAHGLFQRYH